MFGVFYSWLSPKLDIKKWLILLLLLKLSSQSAQPDVEGTALTLVLHFGLNRSHQINVTNHINLFRFKKCSVQALADLRVALNDANGRITDWNINLVSPCFSWSHVTCRDGKVISL